MASSSNVSIDESDNDTTNSSIINEKNGFVPETAVDRYGFIGNKIANKFVYFF